MLNMIVDGLMLQKINEQKPDMVTNISFNIFDLTFFIDP